MLALNESAPINLPQIRREIYDQIANNTLGDIAAICQGDNQKTENEALTHAARNIQIEAIIIVLPFWKYFQIWIPDLTTFPNGCLNLFFLH